MSDFDEVLRYGGAQADVEDDAARKAAEREAKKAEVRKRLEEAGNKKKGKKGFLTPERKKKLRKLLMIKAAEDLKRQQLLKEQERVKILAQRTVALPDVESINDKGKLEAIYNDLFAKVCKLEEEKYDINHIVSSSDTTINALNIEVNDLRGKFVKPSLKKVSKYDNKFKKMAEQKEGGKEKADFRSNLKVVKKENVITQIANAKKKSDKPDWSKGKKDEKEKEVKTEEQVEKTEEEPVEAEEAEEVEEVEEVEEEEEEEEE